MSRRVRWASGSQHLSREGVWSVVTVGGTGGSGTAPPRRELVPGRLSGKPLLALPSPARPLRDQQCSLVGPKPANSLGPLWASKGPGSWPSPEPASEVWERSRNLHFWSCPGLPKAGAGRAKLNAVTEISTMPLTHASGTWLLTAGCRRRALWKRSSP